MSLYKTTRELDIVYDGNMQWIDRGLIIDGATAVSSTKPAAAQAAGGRAAAAKVSVFDRLGGGTSDSDKWGHDGFASLYGQQAAGKSAASKKQAARAPYQAPGLRSAIIKKGAAADLRSQIKGKDLRQRLVLEEILAQALLRTRTASACGGPLRP